MNNYIDSEIILHRKINYIVYIYIMIIIIIVLSLIILSMLSNYKIYYKVKGIVEKEENNYSIEIYIPLEDTKYIIKNDYLIINKEKYKYQIKDINSEYVTDNITTYQIITLDLNLPNKYKYNNLILNIKVIKENKKIIDYLIRKWGNIWKN